MKNRTTTEIIQNILSIGKTKPYQDQLIKKSGISPQQFWKYEKKLLENQRITKTKQGKRIIYQTTKKGEETLQSLLKLHRIRTNILRSINLHKQTEKQNI